MSEWASGALSFQTNKVPFYARGRISAGWLRSAFPTETARSRATSSRRHNNNRERRGIYATISASRRVGRAVIGRDAYDSLGKYARGAISSPSPLRFSGSCSLSRNVVGEAHESRARVEARLAVEWNGRASTSVRLIYAHKQTHTSAPRSSSCRYTYTRTGTEPLLSTTRYTSGALFCFQADRTYTRCLRPSVSFALSFSLSLSRRGSLHNARIRSLHAPTPLWWGNTPRRWEGKGRIGTRRERVIILARREDGISRDAPAFESDTPADGRFLFSSISRKFLLFIITVIFLSWGNLNSTARRSTFAIHLLSGDGYRGFSQSRFKCQLGRQSETRSRRSDFEVVSVFRSRVLRWFRVPARNFAVRESPNCHHLRYDTRGALRTSCRLRLLLCLSGVTSPRDTSTRLPITSRGAEQRQRQASASTESEERAAARMSASHEPSTLLLLFWSGGACAPSASTPPARRREPAPVRPRARRLV